MATPRSKKWVTCVPYISETGQVYISDLLGEEWSTGRPRWGSVAPERMREHALLSVCPILENPTSTVVSLFLGKIIKLSLGNSLAVQRTSLLAQMVKNLPTMWKTCV